MMARANNQAVTWLPATAAKNVKREEEEEEEEEERDDVGYDE